ncbi:MAG TPA: NAD-dependent malic enzyme [Candidatus Eremiobacteraceae bacterium]|nr:NAD-dependent malic enzyme [Candidatus Eremiobacteraceae bacterium]
MREQMKIGFSTIVRIEQITALGTFAHVAQVIAEMGGRIGAVDVYRVGKKTVLRDISIDVQDEDHLAIVVAAIGKIEGVRVVNVSDRTFLAHLGGKIEITPRMPVTNREILSRVYTPGVARVSLAIAADPAKAYALTIKRNTVAIVTDGTAVLGLGDVGPYAAMPVMEGKAMLFKAFAGVDAFPICLDTKSTDEIVETVVRIAPAFGGVNLEDISSPRCFEIERRLDECLDIPVMHDDQHGTAIVILAALLNALRVVGKNLADTRIVVNGIGAAGGACAKILLSAGAADVIGVDRDGALVRGKSYPENEMWQWLADNGNRERFTGPLSQAMKGADVFIGLSRPNLLTVDDLKSMAKDPIVFAMANPLPEIAPDVAEPHVAVMATGRSDYPNQVNNLLAFPGVFRGALDTRARHINEAMKLAAAHAIAGVIGPDELSAEYIIPSVFDTRVVEAVAKATSAAAVESGSARRTPATEDGVPSA